MTVIAFSLARFTPADLREFYEIANPRMARGLWASVARHTGPESDRMQIRLPNLDRPIFSFERDRQGRYTLLYNDSAGWQCIGSGHTAAESLTIWRTRPTRPASPRSNRAG
jgi:hypothetical protein